MNSHSIKGWISRGIRNPFIPKAPVISPDPLPIIINQVSLLVVAHDDIHLTKSVESMMWDGNHIPRIGEDIVLFKGAKYSSLLCRVQSVQTSRMPVEGNRVYFMTSIVAREVVDKK